MVKNNNKIQTTSIKLFDVQSVVVDFKKFSHKGEVVAYKCYGEANSKPASFFVMSTCSFVN